MPMLSRDGQAVRSVLTTAAKERSTERKGDRGSTLRPVVLEFGGEAGALGTNVTARGA
jgi:hypothetical protein